MRILFCHRPGGAFGYITDGMVNALRSKGHIVARWDGLEDSWRNFGPDIYCGASGHKQPIPPKKNCKIAIHVNPYGPVTIPGINESDENIRWTLAQKPDVVFGYGHEEDRILWTYWTSKHGIEWVPLPTAGDKTIFKVMPGVEKKFDLVYLGGKWAYKGITIDAYLMPLLREKKLSYKLHGWGEWPAGVTSGILAEDQACQFLNSGRIAPCIAEQHTHAHGLDIPERAFKVALCGALIVHDPTLALRRMIPSAIIASNPAQFKEYCYHFNKNEPERAKLVEKQRQEVLSNHTYHHRLSGLLRSLGFVEEAHNMLKE